MMIKTKSYSCKSLLFIVHIYAYKDIILLYYSIIRESIIYIILYLVVFPCFKLMVVHKSSDLLPRLSFAVPFITQYV